MNDEGKIFDDGFAKLMIIMIIIMIIYGAIVKERDQREESRRIANQQYYEQMEAIERERQRSKEENNTIPTGRPRKEYYPKPGESWCSIAEAHGWSGYELASFNNKDWLEDGVYLGVPIQVPESWEMS